METNSAQQLIPEAFQWWRQLLEADPERGRGKDVVLRVVVGAKEPRVWHLCFGNRPRVIDGPDGPPPDCELAAEESVFSRIFEGSMTPQEAHGERSLSVRGKVSETLWATLLFDSLLSQWLQSRGPERRAA